MGGEGSGCRGCWRGRSRSGELGLECALNTRVCGWPPNGPIDVECSGMAVTDDAISGKGKHYMVREQMIIQTLAVYKSKSPVTNDDFANIRRVWCVIREYEKKKKTSNEFFFKSRYDSRQQEWVG